MKTSKLPKGDMLHLDYESEPDMVWLTKQETLRKLVGVLGVLLPPLLYLSVRFLTDYKDPLDSISHYYYTRYGSILVIVVSLLAIFLLIYKGRKPADFIFSSVAGFGALALLLLPTSNISGPAEHVAVTCLIDNASRINIHFASAGLFLLSLALMSIFLFPRADKTVTRMKRIRNKFYIGLGVLMLLAMLVIVPGIHFIPKQFYNEHHLTFWMETLAVEFFGVSWLIKGGVILRD